MPDLQLLGNEYPFQFLSISPTALKSDVLYLYFKYRSDWVEIWQEYNLVPKDSSFQALSNGILS